MSDYSKCKMYIILDDNWDCYIGHTTMTLNRRMKYHRRSSNKWPIKLIMNDNTIIELLEDYPCNNLTEARNREQYWMDQFPNRVNSSNAIDKHPSRTEYRKIYYSTVEKERLKERGPFTCECGVVINHNTNTQIKNHKQSKKHINYNLSLLHKDEPNIS